MWTSLLSTIKKVNDNIHNAFKQELNNRMNEKLSIQLAAEKDFYEELTRMCKDIVVIKMENNNAMDYNFKK